MISGPGGRCLRLAAGIGGAGPDGLVPLDADQLGGGYPGPHFLGDLVRGRSPAPDHPAAAGSVKRTAATPTP